MPTLGCFNTHTHTCRACTYIWLQVHTHRLAPTHTRHAQTCAFEPTYLVPHWLDTSGPARSQLRARTSCPARSQARTGRLGPKHELAGPVPSTSWLVRSQARAGWPGASWQARSQTRADGPGGKHEPVSRVPSTSWPVRSQARAARAGSKHDLVGSVPGTS